MQLSKLNVTTQLNIALGAMLAAVCVSLALGLLWLPTEAHGLWIKGGAVILLFVSATAVLALRGIRSQMQRILTPARQAAAGDLHAKFDDNASDEFGAVARAFKDVNDRFLKVVKEFN